MNIQRILRKSSYTLRAEMEKYRLSRLLLRYWSPIILGSVILAYIGYFSYFSVLRYYTLYAHYFDLGIMHQTVYNTFMAFKTGDFSRFLEMTNPQGFEQVKRMAVHNDILLALFSPFYFIYAGPETLLIIQSIALGLGALFVYLIGLQIFKQNAFARLIALAFSLAYLFYPALQHTNQFDFHAVALTTPLLLGMFYSFLRKQYIWLSVFLVLALLSKEQVGLTTAFFGLFMAANSFVDRSHTSKSTERAWGLGVFVVSLTWFLLSMKVIIPHFKSGTHFALEYFGDFGDSTNTIFIGLMKNPPLVFRYLFRKDTYEYLYAILGPFGFLSVLSPVYLLIAAPELAINLLSKSGAMRNIFFHYTAVITPFVVISALYGFKTLLGFARGLRTFSWFFVALFLVCVWYFSSILSPLPYAKNPEVHPFLWPVKERQSVYAWQKKLSDDSLKVAATGHIAPFFSSRRYIYEFAQHSYTLADYVVLSTDEVYNGFESEKATINYNALQKDDRYKLIYKKDLFEVYKKL